MVVTSSVNTKLVKGNTDTDEVNQSGGINVLSDFDDIQARGVHGTRVDSLNSTHLHMSPIISVCREGFNRCKSRREHMREEKNRRQR